jgi:hypothetical protein
MTRDDRSQDEKMAMHDLRRSVAAVTDMVAALGDPSRLDPCVRRQVLVLLFDLQETVNRIERFKADLEHQLDALDRTTRASAAYRRTCSVARGRIRN